MNANETAVVQSVIAALQSLLAGVPAPAPVPVPTPAPTPTPTPVPPPPPIGIGDLIWPMSTTTLFPAHPGVSTSGDAGCAVQFVADNVRFPNGITASFNDQTPMGIGKDYCVSDRPHVFEPLNGNPAALVQGIGNAAAVALRFGVPAGVAIKHYDVVLTPGGTYYINFRQWATPRTDIVWSQFMASAR